MGTDRTRSSVSLARLTTTDDPRIITQIYAGPIKLWTDYSSLVTLDHPDQPRFTRNTALHHGLPLLDALVDSPRRRRRPLSPSPSDSDVSDAEPFSILDNRFQRARTIPCIPRLSSIPTRPFAVPPTPSPSLLMSGKIVAPFSGPLTANGLKLWLSSCEDGFDNYEDTHEKKTLSAKTRIRLTGAALVEPQMAEWWTASKTEFLALTTWEAFVAKLKARFMPVNWKMDALEQFFGCSQGKRDFRTFTADLAQSLGTLPSATISTTVYKYHILFYAHPLLYLRMRALQGFDIDNTTQTPDELIALMTAQWDSLVADNSSRGGRSLPSAFTASLSPSVPLITSAFNVPSTSSPRYVPPTEEEKEALSAVRGCWNCRGNPAVGARPGKDYVAPSPVPVVASAALLPTTNEPAYPPYMYPALTGLAAAAGTVTPPPQDENTESDTDSD
ncbi:hypothetical protein LshimejAT787_1601690 [Lyophyllum shimeji]|uniref:Retrotransposon gag domain-containing protein n=1 Tax=Lyophyllum shimeji TaxID=47721 RepID=A0A9P3PZ34_LYOSH|nr:hypothetical protein LshimejAT787_1601690 [Lyophyllum shimeji]